jgi:hypothetical protein
MAFIVDEEEEDLVVGEGEALAAADRGRLLWPAPAFFKNNLI